MHFFVCFFNIAAVCAYSTNKTICRQRKGNAESIFAAMFGLGKGSGAGMVIFLLGVLGMTVCLVFGGIIRKCKYQEAV